MKLYIVELYETPHKMRGSCDIGGYYTNKQKLVRDIKRHIKEFGEIYSSCHGVNTLEEHAKYDFRYCDFELANIEIINIDNEWRLKWQF